MELSKELSEHIQKEQELIARARAESYQPDKQRLIKEAHKITAQIKELREEQDKKHREVEEKWKVNILKTTLSHLRYCYGSQPENLRLGLITIDVLQWQTPSSLDIELEIQTGKEKRSLDKLLSPATLRMLLERPFNPFYFILESGGYNKKTHKPTGYAIGREYGDEKDIQILSNRTLAIMWVG